VLSQINLAATHLLIAQTRGTLSNQFNDFLGPFEFNYIPSVYPRISPLK
jgi:hypothetical protein